MRAAILGLALLPSSALAAPGFIPVQGVLTDANGVVVDGAVDVTFTLFADSGGTTSLWTDTLSVDVVDGKFAAELGSGVALDLDTFSSFPSVHLQVTVAGDSPMPMVPLDHVPYAAHALNTDKLGGVTIADIRGEIPLTSDLHAAAREVAYDTEQELTDVLDDNYVVTAGTGISITNNAISADQTTIEGWARGVAYDTEQELTDLLDDNYVVTAGAGISISNNQISVDQATVQGWANAVDDDTTYTAGTGLSLNTTEFSVNQATIEAWARGVAYSTPAEVVSALDGQVVDTGCPSGMGKVANFCIHTSSPYARGMDWWTAMDSCLADGFRLCSQTEVVNGLRAGVVEQTDFNVQDTWYTTASQAENSPGAGGENQVCDVQGNPNQPSHPEYSVQCQHEKAWTSAWRATICCY
ncbi:MAG: hypothetical protein EP330_10065 [Deltaproteobacteria bacterium]|nr:MAG: hypothetical protein EP330_10065 [Deltaproteobacteria bacterium]